ncbi:PHP domain-containing protein [Microbacterium oryzae]|uniref:PHP domain-containing protein n=1 Tax=Microbacterium oryzae TaxID=743009 RepID=UPI0025B1EE84|nr:PHP domain-containing protein [Microbacterium oryzae]MDN3309679.1 PHP domain-containing protein [Microbacterium oryzae]
MDEAGAPRVEEPADLHLHSNRSDGTEPPADVARSAHAHGVRTVALTDHDTTAGWAEAADAAVSLGMTFLPGAELSTRLGGRSVHLLAYLFDPDEANLRAQMDDVRGDRMGRAERIVANISRDYDLGWDDVVAQTRTGATVGRPHIADALVAAGIVADRGEAFAGILHPREGYYVPHEAPDVFAAIALVRQAGGVPVMAHPATSSRSGMIPLPTLHDLVDAGLAGFEIDHRENTPSGRRVLQKLVAERDLIATGSSDYHGLGKPNLPGENTTPAAMVERIIAAGVGSRPARP